MEMLLHRFNADTGWNLLPDSEMDSARTLLIIFSSSRPDETLSSELSKLHLSFPNSILIGCSSSGEIYEEDLSDDTIVLAVLRFSDTRLKLVHVPIADAQESAEAGRLLAEQLTADDLTAVFTLTDGLLVNGSAYVKALSNTLPEGGCHGWPGG